MQLFGQVRWPNEFNNVYPRENPQNVDCRNSSAQKEYMLEQNITKVYGKEIRYVHCMPTILKLILFYIYKE